MEPVGIAMAIIAGASGTGSWGANFIRPEEHNCPRRPFQNAAVEMFELIPHSAGSTSCRSGG